MVQAPVYQQERSAPGRNQNQRTRLRKRCSKYTLGTELRDGSRRILERTIEANQSRERAPVLEQLRRELEGFKVLARLCHESQGFSGTRAYLHVAEQVVALSKQNEGWLRQTARSRGGPDQERGPMRRLSHGLPARASVFAHLIKGPRVRPTIRPCGLDQTDAGSRRSE